MRIIESMRIEDHLIHEIKQIIQLGELYSLQELWKNYQDTDFGRELAWEYIFQKIYIHAALKKQKKICEWLDILYLQLDPIQQIGIRHTLLYARYLLKI